MISNALEKIKKNEVNTAVAEQVDYEGKSYLPNVDIYSSNDKLVFLVELPGVKKGDVSIEINESDTLVIRAKNSYQPSGKGVLLGYGIGNFYRAFRLSDDYDKDKLKASIKNGLLEITIPVREEVKPKKISIKA